jgi:hypothetical protein|eukprot:COSAG06_NODE_4844_length_3911_cov_74.679171_3_plen_60_part_00
MMILPRQARDKHRENSKKARFVESDSNSGAGVAVKAIRLTRLMKMMRATRIMKVLQRFQ